MEPVLVKELVEATGGSPLNLPGDAPPIERVCTDSRLVRPGDLFWALKGSRHDGHRFVDEALGRGAMAAVVEHGATHAGQHPLVVVPDTLRALALFARWYRQQREALVIGVTGSVGKTTARDLIHCVLAVRHAGCRSPANYNNEVGLPLSLLELASQDEFAVCEMGAARKGDIRALCQIALPEIGVITRLGPAHLSTFGSLEAIYAGKGELLEALPAAGFAVIWADDERARGLGRRARCPVITVGETSGTALRATDVAFSAGRLSFTADARRYELLVPARHYLVAALCAVAVAREIGLNPEEIQKGLLRFVSAPGRCRAEQLGSVTIIDDSYNASPLSMQAACHCLREWPAAGERLFIAGDMLELGAEAPRWHRELGASVALTAIDRLVALGEQAGEVARGALEAGMSAHQVAACSDLEALFTVLDCWLEGGAVILVKGSRGMQMERVVAWLRKNWSAPGKWNPAPAKACAAA